VFVTVGVESLLQWRMLALDDAAFARLAIAATAIAPQERGHWLKRIALELDPRTEASQPRRLPSGEGASSPQEWRPRLPP
jgi:hypothetical protein